MAKRKAGLKKGTAARAGVRVKIVLPDCTIGPGKVALLEKIAEKGSISAAAKELGLSFRRAWHLIETLNDGLSSPVVETNVGGLTGGGAVLTKTGEAVIRIFREIADDAGARSVKAMGRLKRLGK